MEKGTGIKEDNDGGAGGDDGGEIEPVPALWGAPRIRGGGEPVRNGTNAGCHHHAADMNDVRFLGQDHAGQAQAGAPEVARGPEAPEAEQTENEKHGEEDQPDFVNGVTAVEDEPG